MGAGHHHGAGANARRLTFALLLTGGLLIVEVIGAFTFNSLALLFVVAGYVLFEGVRRLLAPSEVESLGMMAVAAVGLVVNLISMRLLTGGKDAASTSRAPTLKSGPTCSVRSASSLAPR